MEMPENIFEKIDGGGELSIGETAFLLGMQEKSGMEILFRKAYAVKLKNVGNKVYLRGLIELSNICEKNCYYCGIRKSNTLNKRYMMTEEEILKAAIWAYENKYGSIVLQSGERTDETFINFIENIIKNIKKASGGKLGITLCLGEQTEETYRKWFEAGAHRYLLRIETSNRELYGKLHPADHSFDKRLKCLELIKKTGYQIGTGVMTGLPFQTFENLAEDILFFKKMDIDMIGMGPYIPHKDTPLGVRALHENFDKKYALELGLKMIAVTRIVLKDVNIAATTALQALNDKGREMGLMAGANVIMPNITDTKYRAAYQLYQDKPCLDENASLCRECIKKRIEETGESIGYDEWGDSPHFRSRRNDKN